MTAMAIQAAVLLSSNRGSNDSALLGEGQQRSSGDSNAISAKSCFSAGAELSLAGIRKYCLRGQTVPAPQRHAAPVIL